MQNYHGEYVFFVHPNNKWDDRLQRKSLSWDFKSVLAVACYFDWQCLLLSCDKQHFLYTSRLIFLLSQLFFMFHILFFLLLSLHQTGVWCKRIDANKIDQYLLFIPHTLETKTLSSILKSDILMPIESISALFLRIVLAKESNYCDSRIVENQRALALHAGHIWLGEPRICAHCFYLVPHNWSERQREKIVQFQWGIHKPNMSMYVREWVQFAI